MTRQQSRVLVLTAVLGAVASFLATLLLGYMWTGEVDLRQAAVRAGLIGAGLGVALGIGAIKNKLESKVDTDVVLVRPPSAIQSGPDCGEALALGYLAAVLREKGYRAEIIDARLEQINLSQTIDRINDYSSSIVGFTVPFQQLMAPTANMIQTLRFRGVESHITVGGLYPTVAAETLLHNIPELDSVVRFEGEFALLTLLETIDDPEQWSKIDGLVYRSKDDQVVINDPREPIIDLDALPFPERDTLPVVTKLGGFNYVLASRGCRGVCGYCVQPYLKSATEGPGWRGRSPELVVDEVAQCIEGSGNRKISFVDDDFIGRRLEGAAFAQRVAEEIIAKGLEPEILISAQPQTVDLELFRILHRAGLRSVILAVDSFSKPVLRRYGKQHGVDDALQSIRVLYDLGIDAYLGLILFDPWTELEELRENLAVLGDIPFFRPWQLVSQLEVIAGTSMEHRLHREENLRQGRDYLYSYEFERAEVEMVYKAFKRILKHLGPAMDAVDEFRWGSLARGPEEEALIQAHRDEIATISHSLNRAAVRFATEVVDHQMKTAECVGARQLLDREGIAAIKAANEEILASVSKLREGALVAKAAR